MSKLRYLVVLFIALGLISCSATSSGQSSAFTRAITSEPPGLDPHGAAGSGQSAILPYLFDTLVYRDTDNSLKPYLAESWEVAADGLSVTFKLRTDAKFTDGTPLDAPAVVYSFQRLKDQGTKSPLASSLAAVTGMEAVDAHIVRFSFKQPSTTFMGTVSMPYAGIVSPTAAKAEGASFAQKPVGSGAYKLEQWQPGVAITLVRNPDYKWGPAVLKNRAAPHIAKLVFKIVPDAATQLAALQSGELDMVFVNQPGQLATLRADKDVQLTEVTLNSLVYLGFNCGKTPFDDARVRQALSHAVNKAEIVQTALGGIGQVAFAPLAPTLPGFDPGLKAFELGYDPAQAKSLLTEAGFAQGADGSWSKDGKQLKVTLLTSTRPPNPGIATALQSQLQAIGVPVDIQQLDATAAMEASAKGQFDLLLWRYDWNDADVLGIYLSSRGIGSTNRTAYSNKTLDDLLGRASRELDTAKRNQLYLDAQKLILADAPWQPLYTPIETYANRSRVQGLLFGLTGRILLNDAQLVGK